MGPPGAWQRFGQGRERKYFQERAALGLAIWAEMLAAGVGVRRRG